MKGVGAGFVPKVLHVDLSNEIIQVRGEEAASMSRHWSIRFDKHVFSQDEARTWLLRNGLELPLDDCHISMALLPFLLRAYGHPDCRIADRMA